MPRTGQATARPLPLAENPAGLPSIVDMSKTVSSSKLQHIARTHRCRLYRTAKNVLPGEDFFTEVWDCENEPITSRDLPSQDELVASFSGKSETDVRDQVDSYCREHGYFLTGS